MLTLAFTLHPANSKRQKSEFRLGGKMHAGHRQQRCAGCPRAATWAVMWTREPSSDSGGATGSSGLCSVEGVPGCKLEPFPGASLNPSQVLACADMHEIVELPSAVESGGRAGLKVPGTVKRRALGLRLAWLRACLTPMFHAWPDGHAAKAATGRLR